MPRVHLFMCWFVSKITRKVTGGLGRNFQGRLDLAELRDD